MARRHMTQTCTSSFLQTNREFLSVLRLGRVLDLKSDVRLSVQPRCNHVNWVHVFFWQVYLMECRVERWILLLLTGEGRLVSPCRSSIDLLHGVSTDASPLVLSTVSPSKLKERNRDVKKYPWTLMSRIQSSWKIQEKGQKKRLTWQRIVQRIGTPPRHPSLGSLHSETLSPTWEHRKNTLQHFTSLSTRS